MRKPKQVLVFLYRKNKNNEYEYCIFYRKKLQVWQAISGGVEDDETLIETVKREVFEETGIEANDIFELSSVSSIPVVNITGKFSWGNDVYVVTEHSFGVFTENNDIKSFENDFVKITYKAPSTRKSVDTAELKAQGLYDMFLKESPVKSSVMLTWK